MTVNVETQRLIGPRLVLRPLRPSDAGLIAFYCGDVRVAKNLSVVPHPYPPGAAEAFITRSLSPTSREAVWAMDYGADDHAELIGLVSLRDQGDGQGLVGYWVAPQLWGGGFASEALELVIAEARRRGYDQLTASVHVGNDASARVLEKAGFFDVGGGESHSIAHGGMVKTRFYACDL